MTFIFPHQEDQSDLSDQMPDAAGTDREKRPQLEIFENFP